MTAYVYIWFRPDWTPFYVGIGKSPSRWNPARARDRDRNPLCMKILRKHGAQNIHVQTFTGLTWTQACAKEQSLIAHFGRLDCGGVLANFTDGGEGAISPRIEVTQARKSRLMQQDSPLRNAHVVLNTDPEIRRKRLEGLRSPMTTERFSAAATKRWKDPAKREALAEKMRTIWAERRTKNPQTPTAKRMTPEELSRYRSDLLRARNADPEYQSKRIKALKDASEKISQGVRSSQQKRLATFATPEVQAKLRKPKTAEHNRKVSEAKKLWWVQRKAASA